MNVDRLDQSELASLTRAPKGSRLPLRPSLLAIPGSSRHLIYLTQKKRDQDSLVTLLYETYYQCELGQVLTHARVSLGIRQSLDTDLLPLISRTPVGCCNDGYHGTLEILINVSSHTTVP